MGWHILYGTRVPVATMSMENKERRGNFSHIQKYIIRTKRDGYSFAPNVFLSEKMQKPLQFGHRSRRF